MRREEDEQEVTEKRERICSQFPPFPPVQFLQFPGNAIAVAVAWLRQWEMVIMISPIPR